MENQESNNQELYHHGILGQKWGIRRYQNKDGSLTKAGVKRYNKEMEKARAEKNVIATRKKTAAKIEKLNALKKQNEADKAELDGKEKSVRLAKPDTSTKKPKAISEMSNEELAEYKQRLTLEKDAYDLQQKVAALNPPKESVMKSMMSKYGPIIADKAWNDVAKPALNKYIEEAFKAPPGELERLQKEAKIWKEKASIAKDKKNYRDDVEKYEQALKRQEREKQIEKNSEKDIKRAEKAAYKEDKIRARQAEEAAKTKEKAQKEVDDYNNSGRKDDKVTGSQYDSNPNKSSDTGKKVYTKAPHIEDKTVEKVHTTWKDVEGEGTSKFNGWKDTGAKSYVDADYRDVKTNSTSLVPVTSSGRSYVNSNLPSIASFPVALLEDKSGR